MTMQRSLETHGDAEIMSVTLFSGDKGMAQYLRIWATWSGQLLLSDSLTSEISSRASKR